MANEFTLGTALFQSIDEGLETLFSTGLGNFVSLIAPLIGAMVALYFVFQAINWVLSNNTELQTGQLLKNIIYMALFTYYAFNVDHYNSVIATPVGSIGAEISEAFAATGANSPQIIDQMGNQILDTIKTIWDNSPEMSITSLNIVPLIRALATIVIVGVLGAIFMVVSMLYLLIAKIMVSLVLLVGPLFIAFVFFPVTREYFMKWASQLFNYTLLYAMFGMTFTLLTNLLQKYVTGEGFTNTLVGDATQLKLIFCYLLFSGVIMAIPSLTSQLTGGVGINSLGAVSPLMSYATKGMGQLLKQLQKGGGGGGGNTMGDGKRKYG